MTQAAWIFDVLADIAGFAKVNNLERLHASLLNASDALIEDLRMRHDNSEIGERIQDPEAVERAIVIALFGDQ